MMLNFESQCVSVYEELSKAPSLDKVIVSKNDETTSILHWEAFWSQRDIVRNCLIKYQTHGLINHSNETFENTKSSAATELSGEEIMSVSPSGKLRAVMRECKIKDEKHYFLEIWNASRKINNTDLTDQKKHGIVHTNAAFCSFHWSHDGKKIAYIAEKRIPKSKSFFAKCTEETETDGSVGKGKQFLYREDWGEQLVGTFHPTVFVYDIGSSKITDLSSKFPDDVSIAEVLWSADDKSMFALAWHGSPWKLGSNYAQNRPSSLYKLNLDDSELTNLTGGKTCVYSPMLNPNCTKLFYLETVPFSTHAQCSKMMCIDVTGNERNNSSLVVDRVEMPQNSNGFQGLFIDSIPKKTWLSNGHQIILHSIHRSNIALLCVDVITGKVDVLENEGKWNVHYICDDILFVSHSTPNKPATLKAGRYYNSKIEWKTLDAPFPQIDGITWSIQKHEPKLENKDYPGLDYESVLLKPSHNGCTLGLIVNPHGGPHSCYAAGFDLFSACFCKLGFAVLRINFRGSLGFGHNNVLSLLGNIGTQDVSDVQQVAETVVTDLGIPPSKIFIQGVSHGGFLTLHLVGQHPQFYVAGAARNPVTDISSLHSTTDMMDWAYCEGGFDFDYGVVPSPEILEKFLKLSPIVHVSQVKVPLLFMIGAQDIRAPQQQSFEYIHALQGLGKKVCVMKYKDNGHVISNIDAEANCFVNIVMWFYNCNK